MTKQEETTATIPAAECKVLFAANELLIRVLNDHDLLDDYMEVLPDLCREAGL